MIKGGTGGGNTTTGLIFEKDTDLQKELEKNPNLKIVEEKNGKTVKYFSVKLNNYTVGLLLPKDKLYNFL